MRLGQLERVRQMSNRPDGLSADQNFDDVEADRDPGVANLLEVVQGRPGNPLLLRQIDRGGRTGPLL